jgi:two-component system chemotaxis sensor kinase CheA
MATVHLDELGNRLSRVSVANRAELEELREQLLEVARDPDQPDLVRTPAAEALLRLDSLLYTKKKGDRKQDLAEVLSLVRKAAAAAEPAEPVSPQPVVPPSPPAGKARKTKAKAADSVTGNDPGPNLDDLLARLIQLSPADLNELESLRPALLEAARDARIDEAVRTLAAEALLKLDELLYGGNPEESILAETARLIEQAAGMLRKTSAPSEPGSGAPPTASFPPPDPLAASTRPTGEIAEFATRLPADADPDLLEEFVTESLELIEAAEASLLALEVDPGNAEELNTVFRAFHTVKGTSGFLGITSVKELAHRAENLLSRIREGQIRYAGGYADLALRAIDTLKSLVLGVQKALGGAPMVKPESYELLLGQLADPEAAGISESGTPPVVPRLGDLLVSQGAVTRDVVEGIAREQTDRKIGESIVKAGAAPAAVVAKGLRAQKAINQEDAPAENSVRVRTDRLDRLIDMVGELVTAQSMVSQDETVLDGRFPELARKTAQAGKIVRELQDLSMALRMVPLKPTFQKMNRLVRDLAAKAGKRVRLVTFGEDTEIDRNMVDILRDPLVHMIRNAVDHGIEAPEERRQAGKGEEGVVTLSAYHSGGNVVVELRDDGRGLNRQRIIEKAIAQGLIESAAGMSEQDIYNLIFRAGFSTAAQVTEVSGRGVGMDVVRRNIEALRGRIETSSEPGQGSCFKLILPLTMAITDGMLVQAGNERYIIPTVSIVKSFRPESHQLSTIAGRGEMVMLRGELLPLFRLHRLLDIPEAKQDPTEALLVIIAAGDYRYGLMVDELLGQQQVVAKSLGKGLGKVLGISGAAILGDGRVGLILDAAELHQLARRQMVSVTSEVSPESTLDPAFLGSQWREQTYV